MMTGNEVGGLVCVVVGERMGCGIWSVDFAAAVLWESEGDWAVWMERLRVREGVVEVWADGRGV